MDRMTYLKTIDANSIDLILTDPPYSISRDSGMNAHYNTVHSNEQNNIDHVKTIQEWQDYKASNQGTVFNTTQQTYYDKIEL